MTWQPGNLRHNGRWLVQRQAARERRGAVERFCAMTEQVDSGEDQPCIVFTGGDTFWIDEGRTTTPIRFAYEMVIGEPPPEGKRLRMRCDTPGCVRLSHLKTRIISFS